MNELLKELGLVRAEVEDREIVTVELVGDINDADYVTEKTIFYLDREDNIEVLKELINILKDDNNMEAIMSHGFFRRDYDEDNSMSEEELDELSDKICEILDIPFGDDSYCHTLESITIYYTDSEGIIYEMEIA